MKKVSLRDIAEKCNLSMQAVSLALRSGDEVSGTTKVSEKTRMLVRSVAAELGEKVPFTPDGQGAFEYVPLEFPPGFRRNGCSP